MDNSSQTRSQGHQVLICDYRCKGSYHPLVAIMGDHKPTRSCYVLNTTTTPYGLKPLCIIFVYNYQLYSLLALTLTSYGCLNIYTFIKYYCLFNLCSYLNLWLCKHLVVATETIVYVAQLTLYTKRGRNSDQVLLKAILEPAEPDQPLGIGSKNPSKGQQREMLIEIKYL